MGIIELLENYKNIRDAEITDFGEHEIAPPTKFFDKIRTLDGDFFRPLSPMLQKRFEFCSAWKNAYLSQDWLSIQEINNWENNKILCEWLELRKENSCPGEPLVEHPMKNIAIFSINPHEPEEVYLVWDNDDTIEPKIWDYFGADFYTYNSLERYFLYINGIIGDEDTIREHI